MPLSATALEPLLRVALVPGIGPGRLSRLLRRFGSAERILEASPAQLRGVPRIGDELGRRIHEATTETGRQRAQAALRAMERVGAVALTPDDLAFPPSFATVPDPPYLIFALGNLELLRQPGFAVVGTRRPTRYGQEAASSLSAAIAARGYAIVSGMAKGIDAAAHTAALDASGTTIGVLGNGIERVYPAENRPLFVRVRAEGLLLTEFVPGEKPQAGNFPRRNRLIAALSRGVLVVEMGLRSGAQHTVTYALEQGKDVFAVPGPIGSAVSAGTNQLLKDGAQLVTSAQDIIEGLEGVGATEREAPPARRAPPDRSNQRIPAPSPADLLPDERAVLAALYSEPRHIDDLAGGAQMETSAVLGALLGLELRGLVEALPGKHFRRAD